MPSLALQKLTTRIPNDGQIEVALLAMHKLKELDNHELKNKGTNLL